MTWYPEVGSFWRQVGSESPLVRFVAAVDRSKAGVLVVQLTAGAGRAAGTVEWVNREAFEYRVAQAPRRKTVDEYARASADDGVRTAYARMVESGGVSRGRAWTNVSPEECRAAADCLRQSVFSGIQRDDAHYVNGWRHGATSGKRIDRMPRAWTQGYEAGQAALRGAVEESRRFAGGRGGAHGSEEGPAVVGEPGEGGEAGDAGPSAG